MDSRNWGSAADNCIEQTQEAGMRCWHCTHDRMVEIQMEVGGDSLTFRRCSRCDARGWSNGDSALQLNEVLELARVRR